MKIKSRALTCGLMLAIAGAAAFAAGGEGVIKEIKAEQARFIGDINKRDYDKVVAVFDDSYKGLDRDTGPMTLDSRRNMFKERFASTDVSTITILETNVRPMGDNYALLHSHIKVAYQPPKETKDFWYTAVYMKSGGKWKVIHEQ